MTELTPFAAMRIINSVGQSGIPPETGFQYFTAGLEPYLDVIDEEYLASYVRQGGSSFKMVVGVYGGGKTHFLYCVRDLAWKRGFAVSYVSLSPGESPFSDLHLVYRTVMTNLMPPLSAGELVSGYERGIGPFLKTWYARKHLEATEAGLQGHSLREQLLAECEGLSGIESLSFRNAVIAGYQSLLDNDEFGFDEVCQWLTAEGYDRQAHRKHGILQRIDRSTARGMLRSLARWVREIGFAGLVILLDEAERMPSLSTSQRERHLTNLREVIDECGHASFQGVMLFYAVPDERFLEGRTQVYDALRQRVSTVFEEMNPTGVKIELERLSVEPVAFLTEIGSKLSSIYQTAYGFSLDKEDVEATISTIASGAYDQRFGDIGYKRLFVQTAITGLNHLRKHGAPPRADQLGL